MQVFSIKEQRIVENAALHSDDSEPSEYCCCFYTGIRLGELCALKWGDHWILRPEHVHYENGIPYKKLSAGRK